MNSSNNGYGFDAVYQAFNATPGYFLKDDSGELYWGTTTDEMKEALTTLHDWYEKGLINPEVGTTTNGDNANNVKNGTCGIFMGPWWSLGYGNPDSFRNDNTLHKKHSFAKTGRKIFPFTQNTKQPHFSLQNLQKNAAKNGYNYITAAPGHGTLLPCPSAPAAAERPAKRVEK